LSENSAALNRAFQHLSSGQRIVRASEDAAGLSIASRLNIDSRVYSQGVRNLNDGISALSIADGAISELTNIVVRLKELAEQAANGTLGVSQRAALDSEAQSLSDEFLRISQVTTFNNQKLFDGSLQGLALQGGYDTSGTLLASLGGMIGTGSFNNAVNYSTSPTSTEDIALGDLNGDGFADVVTSGGLNVLLGNGDGTLKARVSYVSGVSGNVALGDMNGDGFLDIVSTQYTSSTVSVLLGNGDGTYRARTSFVTAAGDYDVELGDFNRDGVMDIATANVSGSSVSVLIGNGNGSFKARSDYTSGGSTAGLALGDTNGDGITDIVAANLGTANVSVLIGNSDGSFKALVNYITGTTPQNVSLGDLNGDRILDIVTANYGSSSVSVLLGNGNGSFRSKVDYTAGTGTFGVSLADTNGDGFDDIIAANQNANTVSILLSNGNGTFNAKSDFATAAGPQATGIGDLNGDGVVDLVTSSSSATNISVLIGRSQNGIAPLLNFSIKTQADALQAMPIFKNAISNLAAQRGTIGANLSRVEFASNVLKISMENYIAAESQIRDADVAEEAANLARGQILQQAAASILSQANLEPQIALSLLRG
jgi:flagellin-like hook-associated protein FlgL